MTFSLKVAKHMIQENIDKSKNVLFSPVSIDAVLRILAAGAENSMLAQLLELLGHADVQELNEAALELDNALKGSGDDKDAPLISYVNGLWLDKRFSLKAEFENVLRDVHNAHSRVVDFANQGDQAVKEANAWAEKETKGLIKRVFSRNNVNNKTILLLANALYFKGTWETCFEPMYTNMGGFNLLGGHKVRVPFMNQCRELFEYGTYNECQVLRMPYKSGKELDCYYRPTKIFSMYVFLPYEKDGLPNFMKNIVIDEDTFWDQIKFDVVVIKLVSIPKFKFESNVSMKETLMQLGLTLPFVEAKCEDFSGIIEKPEALHVGGIVQHCSIEVNEQGTEAAALTCEMLATCGPPDRNEIKFVADHPFMFMIREDVSGAILFIGTMLNPK